MAKGSTPQRRRGRPSLPPEKAKRYALGIRTTKEVKELLQAAADSTGRSVAQEIEFRLEQSFQEPDLLRRAIRMAYGPQITALVNIIFRIAVFACHGTKSIAPEIEDPVAIDRFLDGLRYICNELKQSKTVSAPAPEFTMENYVDDLLNRLGEDRPKAQWFNWAAEFRTNIGDEFAKRIVSRARSRSSRERGA